MTYHLPKAEQEAHDIEITFLEEIIKTRQADHPSVSMDKKEELLSTHRLRKASEGSIDEELLFGSDSDDSFTKDYEIPKKTLKKERICRLGASLSP